MAAHTLSELFQVPHVLKTHLADKTKRILATIGSVVGEGLTDASNVEWFQHVGFASRPANAVLGKESAEAVVVRSGGQDYAIASFDARALDVYGSLGPGEVTLFGIGADGTAQGRLLIKGDGSINIFTKKGNEKSGTGMGIFVRSDGSIDVLSHSGAALMVGSDGTVKMFNGSCAVQLKAGKAEINGGSQLALSGASVAIGGPAGLPIAIAPQTVAAIAALQVEITALQVECAAIAAALVACMNITGVIVPAHATAAGAATAAVGVAAGILGAQTATVSAQSALIPSKRTTSD